MKSALATLTGFLCLAVALPAFALAPRPASHTANHARIAHGEYLVKGIAGCGDCHTPMNREGQPLPGQWLKGATLSFGPLAPFPGWARTAPDIGGLDDWTTENAVRLLMTGLDPKGHPPRPPMPQYHMNHADASAVVAYLKSLK